MSAIYCNDGVLCKSSGCTMNNRKCEYRGRKEGMSEPKCQACGLDYCVHTLEKQLAERDAALARCVEALNEAAYALFQIKRRTPETIVQFSIEAHGKACEVLDSIPASAQATAKVLAVARKLAGHIVRPSDFEALRDAIREEQEGK